MLIARSCEQKCWAGQKAPNSDVNYFSGTILSTRQSGTATFDQPPNLKMSAFSRGWRLAQCQLRQLPSRTAAFRPRYFTTNSPILRAASKPHVLPAKKSTPRSVAQSPAIYTSYASQLASKGRPTVLYEAPSHILFTLCSYSGAVFCISYAGYNLHTHYFNPPPGLSQWVPIAFAVICVFMAGLGTWLLLGPVRLVRQITAVPSPTTAGVLNLQVTLRKMFPVPFFPARIMTVSLDEISLNHKVSAEPVRPVQLGPSERLRIRRAEEAEQEARREYEQSRIMTAPFRHAGVAFRSTAANMARIWTREGFAKLQVKGQRYKLDVSGGWALDGGKALDRLIKVRMA